MKRQIIRVLIAFFFFELLDFVQTLSLLANAGVIAGIVFLAYEVRQNTEAVRAEELVSRLDADLQRELTMATDPDLQALYIKSLYNPEELTLEELWGISSFLSYRVENLRRAYLSYQDGVTQQIDWEQRAFIVPIYLGSPFGRAYWEHLKADFANTPLFVQAVEEALATSPVVPDNIWLLELQETLNGFE